MKYCHEGPFVVRDYIQVSIRRCLRVTCVLWHFSVLSQTLLANDENLSKKLPLPDGNHSFETLTPDIRDIFVKKALIYLISNNNSYVIESPFNLNGKSPLEKFGKFSDSRKIEFPKKMSLGPWDSIEANEKGLLLLNGKTMRFSKIGFDGVIDSDADIIYDGVLPASDSRGEPPQYEVAQLRAKFLKQLRANSGSHLLSIRRIPKAWKVGSGQTFLALSGLKDYQILLVSCPNGDLDGCKIQRVCRVENYRDRFSTTLTSFALHPERKVILIADRGLQKIHMLNFNSCFHITYSGSTDLPSRLKAFGGIFIDEGKRLWISTIGRDDYTNSSVFYWDENDWSS